MTNGRAAWPYWGLLVVSLCTGAALGLWTVWRLQIAFEDRAFTRGTLLETLVLALGVLGLLATAGWALATRPRAHREPRPEPSVFA